MPLLKSLSESDYQRAFRYARALGADQDLAFDLVQTALVKGLAAANQDLREPIAYLLTSIRHSFYSELKRVKDQAWSALDQIEGVIATDLKPLEDLMIEQEALERAWAQLSPPEREILHLWAVEGYTIDEISLHTETPRGTLLARLHRLRKRLTSQLDQTTSGLAK
ncbi:MAG: RNA polymerase sigma factor [Wenzhouxiangella sp.]